MLNRINSRGFTLVEILVVLVVIGLIAGVAMPNMVKILQSTERAGQRDTLLGEIAGLGYRAYLTGQPITLGEVPVAAGGEAEPQAPFQIPQGWKLEIHQPITYNFNGICSGGKITLVSPDERREIFRLEPPRCKIHGE
ncbi:MAG: prepilin-type N-terminal cleavage/methylation domain-containing protein [Sulfurimicrobium sp.]|nr:prepilin-type N-terminal cleavage/methylation domain-containing protein [Sulfurimicrobium sp.]MDP3685996.1 prepilin-type N-terminal cleavage/methylation domain-containing protein [Sulfurimicrobium sp.]